MKWKLIISVVIILQALFILFLCIHIQYKTNNSLYVFTIKNKYYQYPQIDGLRSFYELRKGIGKLIDLTNIPSWLHKVPAYYINDDGIHGEKNYSVEKPKDIFRIITLGDSFTFGLFVDTADSWPRRLEALLNTNDCSKKIEIINLGMGGYDVRYEQERLIQKGLKYHPDLVLWLLKDDDFLWMNERLNPLLLKYEHELVPPNKQSDTTSSLWKKVFSNAQSDYLKQVTSADINKNGLESLSQVSTLYKGPVVALNLPEYSIDKRSYDILHTFIRNHTNWLWDTNLPNIIQLGGAFPESHPNEKGYQMMAESIFSYLKQHKLVSCFPH